jgi:hypothetical protein
VTQLALIDGGIDPAAAVIGGLWRRACQSLVDSTRCYIECGKELIAKKATLAHGQWLPWLEANKDALGFGNDSTARRLMTAANRASTHDLDDPATAVAISRQLWGNADSQLVQQSLSNEHYTPKQYLAAARKVLGRIDLDPASNTAANRLVKAKAFFSATNDGLAKEWRGKVWLNPPYGGLAGDFVAKFVQEYRAKRVTAGILLVNAHCTDTDWFQPLWDGALCFTDHRINFYGDDDRSGSTHGSVFVYFGKSVAAFKKQFKPFGAVVRKV